MKSSSLWPEPRPGLVRSGPPVWWFPGRGSHVDAFGFGRCGHISKRRDTLLHHYVATDLAQLRAKSLAQFLWHTVLGVAQANNQRNGYTILTATVTPNRQLQLEQLYSAARAQGPGALVSVPDDLRKEVEALLAQDLTLADSVDVATGTPLPVVPGAQLGPYCIGALLGRGGMGQVFRATDTRLNRKVAVKTSLTPFDPRFQREARAIATLNHPNVCTLYDVGPNFLVMEFCEGESLDARIRRGKVPLDETLRIGAQIAFALAAAHAKGIVHRDLKPANVILTKLGVKVLDFGLAKTENDSTLTQSHAVVGTPAYMAPEQRSGSATDPRTDIYALGLVLHEMASGLRLRPDEKSKVEEPAQLAHAISRCLSLDPDSRWQSASDLRSVLEYTATARPAAPALAAKSPLRWIALAAFALAAVAAALWFMRQPLETSANPLDGAQFTRVTDFEGSETDAAISRDGRYVAFRSDRDGPVDSWITQVGTGRFLNLTHGMQNPAIVRNLGFTPDGSEVWLAGIPGGTRLRLMPVSGGVARSILTDHALNLAWTPDGKRIVTQSYDAGDPFVVSDPNGTNARQIFVDTPGRHSHFPSWSTDAQWIYYVGGVWDARQMDIWRMRPDGKDRQQLTQLNTDVKYLAPLDAFTVLFTAPAEDGSGPWLWSLDPERKQIRRVSLGLERYTSIDASADGQRLVATVSNPTANLSTIPITAGVATQSDVKPLRLPTVRAFGPRYGGGALFYLSSRGGGDGVWKFQQGESTEVWRGVDGPLLEPPAVSADGRRIAIILRRQGKRLLCTIAADGGDLKTLNDSFDASSSAAWSPDGQWLTVAGNDGGGLGLFKIPSAGGKPTLLAKGPMASPIWSPDGSLIVYTGPAVAATGPLLMVQPDGTAVAAPPLQARVGGERYRFVPGTRQLIYIAGGMTDKQTFWLLDIPTKKTRKLADLDLATTRTFDITPDGKQIIFDSLRENSDIVLITRTAKR